MSWTGSPKFWKKDNERIRPNLPPLSLHSETYRAFDSIKRQFRDDPFFQRSTSSTDLTDK
jgi:hypothetical protein